MEKQNRMPEPEKHRRSSSECEMPGMWKWPAVLGSDSRMLKQNEESPDESPYHALTRPDVTTPTASITDIRTVDNSHLLETPPSRPLRRLRSHRSSHSSDTVKVASNAPGKAPERISPPPSSDNEYGEVIAPRLDLVALSQLPPRLQESMLALQRERHLRAAQQVERLPLPTPQRATPLGSHPPTDDEREYARGLTQRYREAATPPSRLRTGPQVNRIIAPFMEDEGRRLPETVGRRSPKSKVAERLASAKKWMKGMFGEKGGVDGGGQGGEGVEGDGEEEEEKDVAPGGAQQMTSRGRMERYF